MVAYITQGPFGVVQKTRGLRAEPSSMDAVGDELGRPESGGTDERSAGNNREDLNDTNLTETDRLRDLQTEIRDQDDLERDIGHQADQLLFQQADERDQQRLDKTRLSKDKLEVSIRRLRDRLVQNIGSTHRAKLQNDVVRLQEQSDDAAAEMQEIQERIDQRTREIGQSTQETVGSGRMPNETQRDFLIRTGKITPFSKIGLATRRKSVTNLKEALLDAEEGSADEDEIHLPEENVKFMSHRNLRLPGFATTRVPDLSSEDDPDSATPRKRRRLMQIEHSTASSEKSSRSRPTIASSSEAGSDNFSAEEDSDEMLTTNPTRRRRKRGKGEATGVKPDYEDLRGVDDGNEAVYMSRLKDWSFRRREARHRFAQSSQRIDGNSHDQSDEESPLDEIQRPHPEIDDTVVGEGYRIPGDIYPSLFEYQKTGVRWLWQLYEQQVGGIVGDEMGLGKTIQIIAFLAGLHYSGKLKKPIIVVCPATVMKQWVTEFHRWWPPFRVSILHSSGSGMINLGRESRHEDDLLDQVWNPQSRGRPLTAGQKTAKKVLEPVLRHGGVLVTTYSGLQTYAPLLIPVEWQYCVLDEGHKIRNPNTAITIYCKELRCANRVILSGTPMQNNLIELWSLFDFVFPMRLGTLVNFRNQFEIPIRQGGYASASNLQVQTALRCAETLKDAISPYLLQRFKADVAADLPKKSEQVLFCRLTQLQRRAYEDFLASDEMQSIMGGRRQVLYGVDILRKICNHPDLQDHKNLSVKPGYTYGTASKAGKMQVVGSLLELWKNNGHKTLLFAQHRIMLDILENYLKSMPGMKYRRMDGNTAIHARQSMVDEFNTDPNIHVFLLTTKVGGLGINLTGADRVIIYDPDWNPSTDLQARERAWRLGQKREVTIYRLMTAGTIEEKIYHRQIFKQFLTNRILRDPKQRQTFHLSDLHDLFTLAAEGAPTETSTLFKGADVKPTKSSSELTSPQVDREQGLNKSGTAQDLQKVRGIQSVQEFDAPNEESNPDGGANSESRLMEGIFARSSIHSAVEHDQIVGGKKVITADPQIIEREAKKVAAEAAKELKRAGAVARTVPAGTPTWTGQVGISGRPQEVSVAQAFGSSGRHTGAPSSSSLLAGLHRRPVLGTAGGTNSAARRGPGLATPSDSANESSRSGTPNATRGRDFGKLIRDYLMAHGGSVFTQMLIDHFNRFCNTPQATTEFRETLKVIATLQQGSRGRGKWVLKEEYKPDQ